MAKEDRNKDARSQEKELLRKAPSWLTKQGAALIEYCVKTCGEC